MINPLVNFEIIVVGKLLYFKALVFIVLFIGGSAYISVNHSQSFLKYLSKKQQFTVKNEY
jgi:hypothetical protein